MHSKADEPVPDALSAMAPAHLASSGPAAPTAPQAQRLQGLPPVVGPNTRLLILGSFPGQRSLQARRYYAHPQNQFWRLLDCTLGGPEDPVTATLDDAGRLQQLLRWGLGVWDVYASCERSGSLDRAIRHPALNDFVGLARQLPQLQGLAFNGGESWKHHRRVAQVLDVPLWRLPSSSPAHASWTLARKAQAWRAVFAQAGLPVRAP